MTLIKSISGIRGTIGGQPGKNLTPQDLVECTAAFGQWVLKNSGIPKVVIGRDARISGEMVHGLVSNTLIALGIDVIDLGLSTTPTVEIAVVHQKAGGGIILTASHNPKEWNALKFLNSHGEFISQQDGQDVLKLIDEAVTYADVSALGKLEEHEYYMDHHIQEILKLDDVLVDKIKARKFKVVIDPINSTGTIALPLLLRQLDVDFKLIHAEPHGIFAHNPEPLAHNLKDLSEKVITEKADLGISVDPDVDRLALVCEDGSMFGEEFTLVAVADYILSKNPGPSVSNVSSTMVLKEITHKHNQPYYASAVGEVNVVTKMKEVNAVIGGEGNGGIIYPPLHYGRDALVGIALFLSYLAEKGQSMTALKEEYPASFMVKDKIQLPDNLDQASIFKRIKEQIQDGAFNEIDGLKIEWDDAWVQIRASNTEPILRIYSEAKALEKAQTLIDQIKQLII